MSDRITVQRELELSLCGFFRDQWYGIVFGLGLSALIGVAITAILTFCK